MLRAPEDKKRGVTAGRGLLAKLYALQSSLGTSKLEDTNLGLFTSPHDTTRGVLKKVEDLGTLQGVCGASDGKVLRMRTRGCNLVEKHEGYVHKRAGRSEIQPHTCWQTNCDKYDQIVTVQGASPRLHSALYGMHEFPRSCVISGTLYFASTPCI